MSVPDIHDKRSLYDALVELEKEGPHRIQFGICYHVQAYGGNTRVQLLERLFKRWPKFSGADEYPVPGVHGYDCRECYAARDVWAGPYGDLRRELLAFCIEELRKEI